MYQDQDATVEITYGLYLEYKKGRPYYKHNLCEKAAKELWDKCNILVNLGDMYWSNKIIKNG